MAHEGSQFHVERDAGSGLTATGCIGETERATALSVLDHLEDGPERDRVVKAVTEAPPTSLPHGAPARMVSCEAGDLAWFLARLQARVGDSRLTHDERRALNRLTLQLTYMSGHLAS
jgi:hypothetical protein